jgi:hypothetical protein
VVAFWDSARLADFRLDLFLYKKMSIQPSILCPHCGTQIEIEAKAIQGELALGPIEVTKNKLDAQGPVLQAERPRDTIRIGSNAESGSFSESSSSFQPLAERDSNRFVPDSGFASCEEDLIDSIRKIVGEKDWTKNGAGWRSVSKHCRPAILLAIEDWKLAAPRRHEIRNPAAWLSDRFKRAKSEIQRSNAQQKRA